MDQTDLTKIIRAFSRLGEVLTAYTTRNINLNAPDPGFTDLFNILDSACAEASARNPWFIPDHIHYALSAWAENLNEEKLAKWTEKYEHVFAKERPSRTIGVVMAGNIPLVGFHDLLCVLITGNKIAAKMSSRDEILLPAIAKILISAEPGFSSRIAFVPGTLRGFDAVIATGSNNTSNYFEYYFGNYPHLIRKNRNGIAVLNGKESREDLRALADDIFLYFGLGCRSVSKLYLPEGYDLEKLKDATGKYSGYSQNHKYRNNYDYYKAIYLVNRETFTDTGNLLIREEQQIASPVSVLHFETYADIEKLRQHLESISAGIQCIVSLDPVPFRGCLPGRSQRPALDEYADGVDTLKFLLSLS